MKPKTIPGFHAVEFMRMRRDEISEEISNMTDEEIIKHFRLKGKYLQKFNPSEAAEDPEDYSHED